MASGSINHLVVDGEWTDDVRGIFAAMQMEMGEIVGNLTGWQSFIPFRPLGEGRGEGVSIRKMTFRDFSEFMDRHTHRHVYQSYPGLVEEPADANLLCGRVSRPRANAFDSYTDQGVYDNNFNYSIVAICEQLQTQREEAQRIVGIINSGEKFKFLRWSSRYTVGKTEAFYCRADTGHAIVTITGENPAHIRATLYAMYALFFNGRQRESVIKTCLFQPKDLAFNATDRFILHAAFDYKEPERFMY